MKKIVLFFYLNLLMTSLIAQEQFAEADFINTSFFSNTTSYVADIDGDHDLDIILGNAHDNVLWHENIDGKGTFGPYNTISTAPDNISDICAADLDGDGDMDIITASWMDDAISWFENTDGKGTFSARMIVSTQADAAWSVSTGDLDKDGDMDIISGSFSDSKLAWYENTDGEGTFSAEQVIATDALGVRRIYMDDLNGDTYLDILTANQSNNAITWYENLGDGSYGVRQIISNDHTDPWATMSADIDGDGDKDVIACSRGDNELAWFENTDGQGTFGAQQIISTVELYTHDCYAADVDFDGDMDVLSAARNDSTYAWFENMDGKGTFGPRQLVAKAHDKTDDICVADFNKDGKNDVLAVSNYGDVYWYKNIMPPAYELDSTDLSCYNSTDGAVTLRMIAGEEPLSFLWSNGETTQDIEGLEAQKYIVIVTDATGIGVKDSILVNAPDKPEDVLLPVVICEGESYFAEGADRYESGTYYDTLVSVLTGCDSVVITALTVAEAEDVMLPVVICEGESYFAEGADRYESGTYYDTLTSVLTGCDSVIITELTVTIVDESVNQTDNVLEAVNGDADYQWIDCSDNSPIEGETNRIFTATKSGEYALVIGLNTCTDTSDCYTVTISDIENNRRDDIQVYPNPSKGLINILLPVVSDEIMLEITDLKGMSVYKTRVGGQANIQINSDLSPGMYILSISFDETIYRKKLILEF